MAKRTRTKSANKKLPSMEDVDLRGDEIEIPDALQELADKYKSASISKSRANDKFTAARDALIEGMEEHGIEAVRVDMGGGVEKTIELQHPGKLVEKKRKKAESDED